MTPPIAIIGMSCIYPDARSPLELWENVLAQRRAFRRLPSERLRIEDYLSPDRNAPDCTYAGEASVIEGYEFDRVAFRVVGSTYRSADLAHWLALDVASRALQDAGFKQGEGLPRETTGIVLGNTLTGEFSRANVLRLRWPYVRRVLESTLLERGWVGEERRSFLDQLEARYKAPFPPVGEESLAGGLSNTIAGRICNQFDLKGGGYTVDGACSSSLLAIAQACSALTAGDLDVALAGGVDLSLDPFELVGFAKTGALAPEEMRIYDARSSGFWPGEGCGFVVLMRHEEAVEQCRRIYAVVRGWGISSDGSGGITRPEVEGQLQALRRAYRRAGFGPESVEYFEGHGTGTSVGDATELQVISRARREGKGDAPPAAIGSIKGNIGHTKAAAGVAGFIKAAMAVHCQILPPTTGCERPHPELSCPSPALRILREGELWPEDRPLRAGVSAMGFGGINAHLVLEGITTERKKRFSPHELTLLHSAQDTELLLFRAPDVDALRRQVERVLSFAARLSRFELTDLAVLLERDLDVSGEVRAAVVAPSPKELQARLKILQSWLNDGTTDQIDFLSGVFLGAGKTAPRIGFLFPGQGSPLHLDGGIFRRRFHFARQLYDRAGLPLEAHGNSTAIAQPAVMAATLTGLRALDMLGISASVAVGHSLGEIAALHWAGAFDENALLRIARVRGQAMAELGSPTGLMAAITAPWREVSVLVNGDPVGIVGYNSPRQTVVAGEAQAVQEIATRARSKGLQTINLPVSHAFHTPLVAAAIPVLAAQLSRETFGDVERSVISTVSGVPLTRGEDLQALLCRQVTSPVRFIEAVTLAAREVDLFIEVGPGRVLTGLVGEIVGKPVVGLDAAGPSLQGLLHAAGAAFALGCPVKTAPLFRERFARPFSLEWKPRFFANPCELAPVIDQTANDREPAPRPREQPMEIPAGPEAEQSSSGSREKVCPPPLELVRQLVAQRTELPVSAVQDESRMLSDLHLNSITVGQLVAEAARRLGLPPLIGLNDFANATVGSMAQALEELLRTGRNSPAEILAVPPGVDSWIHSFIIDRVEQSPPTRPDPIEKGEWQIFAAPNHPLASRLQKELGTAGGSGVVVCLPAEPSEDHIILLLQASRAASSETPRFVLVHQGWGASGFVRTLHLERPELITCLVEVPFAHPQAVEWIITEALAASGHSEAQYDADGRRWEPRLKLLPSLPLAADFPLGPEDVLLVSGGGKGIAAECALSLGRSSGARLVLLGRAAPETDPELATNLERISAAGVDCRYFAADVTNAEAVRKAVGAAVAELGPITAILHGAGSNVPQLVTSLTEQSFRQTLAPKVQGLRHLLAAVNAAQLRLLVTFSSIIARSGLPGEADYAVANEWLTGLTERFQKEQPQCRCLAVEWSVWSGVGMGQRLGRIESLIQQGITPIPPEQGVEILERLLRQPLPSTAVVVTGRFGEHSTLKMEMPELPFLRFLEKTKVHYPGVELVVEAVLSSDSDPYLDDHVYQGERLFAAVMGMEAMAQTAMALTESGQPPAFENVQLHRPVVVPRNKQLTIRLAALVREPGVVEVSLRSEETGFQIDHFRAMCRFPASSAIHNRGEADDEALTPFTFREECLSLEPGQDLYGDLLFHTGRFKRLKAYQHLQANECVAEIASGAGTVWFGRYLPPSLVLGDAGTRDAAIHAIQACIPHARLLPTGVDQVLTGILPVSGACFVHAREQSREGDLFTYDLELIAADGSVIEQWRGLHLRIVEWLKRRELWPEALLGPYIQRRVEELIPRAQVTVVVERNSQSERQARSDRAMHQALGTQAPLWRRPDGKPETRGTAKVSSAHARDLTMAVASESLTSCDLEPVMPRLPQTWQDLLGPVRFRLAHVISQETGNDREGAATRVWVAAECLKKAGAVAEAPLLFAEAQPDGWVMLSSGSLIIATYIASVHQATCELAFGVLVRADA